MIINRRSALMMLPSLALAVSGASAAIAQSARPAERLKIRFALSGAVSEALGYRVAKSLGYLNDENLEVDEQHIESRTLARDTVANGQVDITNTGITTSLRAIELGQPIRVVGGIVAMQPVFIAASAAFLKKNNVTVETFKAWSPQERVKFLIANNARWASSIPGSLTDYVSLSQLKSLGVDASRQLDIHYYPTPPNAIDNFYQGTNIDVVISNEVTIVRLARLLKVKDVSELPLVFTRKELDQYAPFSLVPGEQWIANLKVANPEALVRFLRAYLRGTNYFLSRPVEEITALILKDNPDIVSEAAKTAIAESIAFSYRVTPANGELSDAQIKAAIEFCREQGQIKGNLNIDQVIDYSFVRAAAKGLKLAASSTGAQQ